ncbi:MAG: hypothetical protein V1886_01430 [archaeon]
MKKQKSKIKALCLLSGGLDSRLACKIMQEQCDVEAVFFILPFGSDGSAEDATNFSEENTIKLHVIDCTKGELFRKYLEIIRHPKHGYGSGINPCIDCHIFLLKEAKKLAKKIKADLIVTGEVLNERPMSQHKKALDYVEIESGLGGKLLRPLSANLLSETSAEKAGLINRDKFLAIQGRNRQQQMELAKKYRISFPQPGGGCMLCEKEFAARLKDLFRNENKISSKDIELLKIGRHYRISNAKLVVGRNEIENKEIREIAGKNDLLFEAVDIPSPTSILIGSQDSKTVRKAAEITAMHSDANEDTVPICIMPKKKIIKSGKARREEAEALRIQFRANNS